MKRILNATSRFFFALALGSILLAQIPGRTAFAGGGGDGDGIDILPRITFGPAVPSLRGPGGDSRSRIQQDQGIIMIAMVAEVAPGDSIPPVDLLKVITTTNPMRDLTTLALAIDRHPAFEGREMVIAYGSLEASAPEIVIRFSAGR